MASSRTEPEVLDLVDIAFLLHYGMFTTDPRLRGSKLLEVAYPGEQLTTAKLMTSDFLPNYGRSQTTILFEIPSTQTPAGSAKGPDLPSNMVSSESLTLNPKLNLLTPKQLETLFYQARGFTGCLTAAALLERFFLSFRSPPSCTYATDPPRVVQRAAPATPIPPELTPFASWRRDLSDPSSAPPSSSIQPARST